MDEKMAALMDKKKVEKMVVKTDEMRVEKMAVSMVVVSAELLV